MSAPDYTRVAQAVQKAAPPAPFRLRQGTIVSAAADGTATVTIGGGSTQLAGVKVAASCCPLPGASCWLATDGRDLIVLQTLAPNGPAYLNASRVASLSVATSTTTLVPWDTETTDTAGMFIPGASSATITVPGLYSVNVQLAWPGSATGTRLVRVLRNGTSVVNYRDGGLAAGQTTLVSWIDKWALGDSLSVDAWQDSGGALTVTGSITAVWEGAA